MLIGALFGLATAIIWGTGDFFSRKPSSQIGSFPTSVYAQPIGLVLMLVVLAASGEKGAISEITSNPGFLAINLSVGISAFVGLSFLFRGYSSGVMSIVAPIAGAYPAISVTLSIVILGSVVTLITGISIAAIIVGIILAGVKLSEFRPGAQGPMISRNKLISGVDSGLVACICAGLTLFGIGIVSPAFGYFLPTVLLKTVETVAAFSIAFAFKIKLVRPKISTLSWIALIGTCDAAGFATFGYGVLVGGGDLPIIFTLSGLVGVVTTFLAVAFYHERLEKIQAFGIGIIFVAVAALLYF